MDKVKPRKFLGNVTTHVNTLSLLCVVDDEFVRFCNAVREASKQKGIL